MDGLSLSGSIYVGSLNTAASFMASKLDKYISHRCCNMRYAWPVSGLTWPTKISDLIIRSKLRAKPSTNRNGKQTIKKNGPKNKTKI